MKYLVDSNIFIYALNENVICKKFFENYHKDSSYSIISRLEILSYNYTDDELKELKDFLSNFNCINVNFEIIDKAVKNTYKKRIKVPDNIIVSTAMVNNLKLVTANEKDFKGLDIEIINPLSP